LISHAHHDHLDLPSLKLLPGSPELIVPRGLRQLLRDRGFDRVREVTPGDEIDVAGLTIRVTHAEHEGNRAGSSVRVQPVGYALLGTTRVFFAGDTDLFPELAGLVPELDVALLPIWGWGASLGSGHLDPLRAAEALALLRPRVAIPIHWGSLRPLYRRPGAKFLRAPVDAFVAAASRLAPQVDVRVLAPGESCVLD
jgi:L-ascorbate metabolism protein UlaG (beta-lactamase superfamily)